MNTLLSPLQRWAAFLSEPHWLRGGAVLRICFGIIVSSIFVLHVRDREFLYGPHGLFPWQNAHDLSVARHYIDVFSLNGSDWYFTLCFFLGVIVCLAFTFGIGTRIVTPLFVIYTWSIFHREPDLMDGGYRLMNIMLIYVFLADLGRYYSLDAWIAARRGIELRTGSVRAILHNTGIMMCMYQVCLVYLFSTFYKVTGTAWQNGTALYYAMTNLQFNTGILADVVTSHPLLLTIGNYVTLLYQSAFVWLIWHPRLKYLMIATAVGFHLSIAVFMGLPWFSAVMISCEAIFLSDRDYLAIEEWLARFRFDKGRSDELALPTA